MSSCPSAGWGWVWLFKPRVTGNHYVTWKYVTSSQDAVTVRKGSCGDPTASPIWKPEAAGTTQPVSPSGSVTGCTFQEADLALCFLSRPLDGSRWAQKPRPGCLVGPESLLEEPGGALLPDAGTSLHWEQSKGHAFHDNTVSRAQRVYELNQKPVVTLWPGWDTLGEPSALPRGSQCVQEADRRMDSHCAVMGRGGLRDKGT